MFKLRIASAILYFCASAVGLNAQGPGKVDFRRDVQPIFKTYCIGCHGPTQQMNGFRVDRRRDAMRGGTIAVIGPGNSAGSRLYQRLIGDQFGLRMPPTGPLSAEQINIVKAWIDQGAEWPDDVSGETPAPPPDPAATRLMEALRRADYAAFQKKLNDDPKAATRKGPGGSTPLMYAALYGDSDSVRRLLAAGADPNARNEAGATALMWAVNDPEKTRLVVEHSADVNARSDNARTPLLIAAARFGSAPVLKLLLEHGANPNAQSSALFGMMTPLAEAAYASDATAMRTLIEHGADVNGAGVNTVSFALLENCAACASLVIGSTSKPDLNLALIFDAPPLGDTLAIKTLLDHGADPIVKDPDGNTLVTLAAASDALPVDLIRTLIDDGVGVNDKGPHGEAALDLAMRMGHTPVVDLLTKAGAKLSAEGSEAVSVTPAPAHTAREAVERSIPLLQQTDVTFMKKSGCVSCHNNTLTAMTVAAARDRGIPVNDQIAAKQLQAVATYIEGWRDRALQGVGIPGDSDTIGAILVGMAAANYPPDPATDAIALFLKNHQSPDGRWYVVAHRPPLESSDIQMTATAMHAIQVYAPPTERADCDRAVQRAASWLAKAQPRTTHDRAYQLLGLAWARPSQESGQGSDQKLINKAAAALLAEQRPDGGWAQIPSLTSDAFATGQALVALNQSGALTVTDPAFQRGVQFLMNTQLEYRSWYVKRRALPIQPFFESGFPHGRDQFISAAATNWAATALALAAAPRTSALLKRHN